MKSKQVSIAHKKLKNILQFNQTLTVVGANWGDEGKGKIIDYVMQFYHITARFSGGANAGHTVFTTQGDKLVSHLIPCGLAQHKICVLGRGEFFNSKIFLEELAEAKKILKNRLPPIFIDQQAALWTPYHRLFEGYVEIMRGVNKIGTTNKGIGPLEGLYKLRLAPVVGYLFNKELLEKSLTSLYNVLRPSFEHLTRTKLWTETVPTPKQVAKQLLREGLKIKNKVIDTSFYLHQELQKGKRILFEGAQATGLDAWWGTYPYISSGNSVAAGAALGTGLPNTVFDSTILVAKTLPTRVGRGPFPSEIWQRDQAMGFAKQNPQLFKPGAERENFLRDRLKKINGQKHNSGEVSQYFQVLGDERGATTGRGRSVGYLDIPWLLYAIRINHPKFLALTRFDMLSGLKSIPVVASYKTKGKILSAGQIPPSWHLENVNVIKEDWPCWQEDISGCNDFSQLPKSAQKFIRKLETYLGVPILFIGTGPEREEIIVRV